MGAPVYPWSKWFNKGVFKVRKGRHFHHSLDAMTAQIRSAAKKYRLRVSIARTPNQRSLIVSVLGEDKTLYRSPRIARRMEKMRVTKINRVLREEKKKENQSNE